MARVTISDTCLTVLSSSACSSLRWYQLIPMFSLTIFFTLKLKLNLRFLVATPGFRESNGYYFFLSPSKLTAALCFEFIFV